MTQVLIKKKNKFCKLKSFNLVQNVVGPTHQQGVHKLDLVLYFGLSVDILEIGDAVVSDHKPFSFETSFFCESKSPAPGRSCQLFNSSTAALFSSTFITNAITNLKPLD